MSQWVMKIHLQLMCVLYKCTRLYFVCSISADSNRLQCDDQFQLEFSSETVTLLPKLCPFLKFAFLSLSDICLQGQEIKRRRITDEFSAVTVDQIIS